LTSASPGVGSKLPRTVHPADEVVISMRPVSVFAKGPGSEIELLRTELRGRWRQAGRAVMVLLSLHGLAPSQTAELLECHLATVRRWIGRLNAEGLAGRPDRPRLLRIVARLLELPRRRVILAEDETHLNLLPHVRVNWTLRGARPEVLTPGGGWRSG
jgi:transposase